MLDPSEIWIQGKMSRACVFCVKKARQQSCCFLLWLSVSHSVRGSDVTITHDVLELTI